MAVEMNPLLYLDLNEFPPWIPLLTPASGQTCRSEVPQTSPRATATQYLRPSPLLSLVTQLSRSFPQSAELFSSSSLCCYWFLFSFFSLFKSQVKEQIVYKLHSSTQIQKHIHISVKLPRLFQWLLSLKAKDF